MKERVSCLWSNRTLYVHLNTIEPNTGQALTALNPEAAQAFTAERVLRTRPGIVFRAVVAVVLTTLGIWMFVLTAHGITRASLLWVYYVTL
jgi:hypothetical protein